MSTPIPTSIPETQTPTLSLHPIQPTQTYILLEPVFGEEEILLFKDFPDIHITEYKISDFSLEGKSSKYLLVAFYRADELLNEYAGFTSSGRSFQVAEHTFDWPEIFLGFNKDERMVDFINCLTPSITDWQNTTNLKREIIGIYPISKKTFFTLKEADFAPIWFGNAFDDALAIKNASTERIEDCTKSVLKKY